MANLKNPAQIYPMVITKKISETKEFYLKAGFKIRHEMGERYLQVYYEPGDELDLCFMSPDAMEGGEKEFPAFTGSGLFFSIPTPNADEKCAEFEKLGVPIEAPLADKPWGWRSFYVRDPNGCVLDFFHVYKAPLAGS